MVSPMEPKCPPTLSKNGLKIDCRQYYNVPVIFPSVAGPGGSAADLEDEETDEEMPDLGIDSSDEDGWQTASGNKRNKPKSSQKVKARSRP